MYLTITHWIGTGCVVVVIMGHFIGLLTMVFCNELFLNWFSDFLIRTHSPWPYIYPCDRCILVHHQH